MENKNKNQQVNAPATNSVKSAKAAEKPTQKRATKKPRKSLRQMFKEIGSELKKVSWPNFPTVVKKTSVVIVVVLVFAVVLLGFDTLFSLLYDLLVSSTVG